jgi:hypothetical protein
MVLSHPVSSLNLRARRSYVRPPVPLHFPVEETLPESVEHRRRLNVLFESVRREFAGRAIVACDQFLYWDATDPKKRLAPDLAVRVGNTVERLPSWMTWKLGAPQVGVEIVSDFDRAEGPFARKLERYRRAGIVEVVHFDAADAEQPLRLWDSFDGDLVERNLGGPEALHCDALALYWCVREDPELGRVLRLARDAQGENVVLTPEEAERAAKEAALVANEAALARIAELEAELGKR